jgi:hypothetical protein
MIRTLAVLLLWSTAMAAEIRFSRIPVDTVWSGHSVGFAITTVAPWQYAAYYDKDRRMIIAQRRLAETNWKRQVLPSTLVWDSHNYVTLIVDPRGFLHVSGNMHVSPLVYFRSTRPHDITSLVSNRMTGERELRVTYPQFVLTSNGTLLFNYRDGRSGEGDTLWNRWVPEKSQWVSHMDQPLFDGERAMNSYPSAPVAGPDGFQHLVWVWRDTSDASTCHDLGYAKTVDFKTWFTASGEPIQLPIRLKSPGATVDPIPPKGGIVNGSARIGFDAAKRVIVSYTKYDTNGHSQIYTAVFAGGEWKPSPITDWKYRWEFGGGGSIKFDVGCSAVMVEDGRLVIATSRPGESKRWALDPATLKPTAPVPARAEDDAVSKELGPVKSKFEGMLRRTAGCPGEAPNVRYLLRWETLGPNRDKPREGPLPEASPLELIRIETK